MLGRPKCSGSQPISSAPPAACGNCWQILAALHLETRQRLRCVTSGRSSLQHSMQHGQRRKPKRPHPARSACGNRVAADSLPYAERILQPDRQRFRSDADRWGASHIVRRNTSCVLVEIEDTGPGIPHKIRDRLFEPFVTAGKRDGLGLGLAISRQSVLNHGGDIWTEPASGARFVIRLPLKRARSSQSVYMLAESSTSDEVSNR